jgi:hypothetical protein
MLAVSDAAWGFFAAFVTGFCTVIVALITLLIRQSRTSSSIEQINRAVNHQGDDAPTLVERVVTIERETALHRQWEHKVFTALAVHVGFTLPEREDGHDYDQAS